jgi:putative ABC transport system permease protein
MPGFGELMDLQLIDGRFFKESMVDSQAIVLNEAAVKLLGLEPRAGQKVLYNDEPVEIIGVVRDFYYRSNPGDPIYPLVLANCFWGTPYIYIRSEAPLSGDQNDKIKAIFQQFDPDYQFHASLLTDTYENMYHKENRLAKLVLFGGVMEIIISVISLLVLTILKVSRRTKEIGIRKVNGSSIARVIALLLKETLIIVLTAIVVASVISYFVMDSWLMDYVSRIGLHPGYFLLSATFVLLLTLSATIWQAWRGASRNPTESLRYE